MSKTKHSLKRLLTNNGQLLYDASYTGFIERPGGLIANSKKSLLNTLSLIVVYLMIAAGNAFCARVSTGDGFEFGITSAGVVEDTKDNSVDISGGFSGGFSYLTDVDSEGSFTAFTGSISSIAGGWNFTSDVTENLKVVADFTEMADHIDVNGYVEETSGSTDKSLWLQFKLPLDANGWKWWATINYQLTVPGTVDEPSQTFLYPLPTAAGPLTGVSMAIHPLSPIVFRSGCDNDGLWLKFAIGLTPDTVKFPSKAKFNFRIYKVDKDWGFRDSLEKYYTWFDDYYDIPDWKIERLYHIGIWHHGGGFTPDRDFEERDAHMAYFNLKGQAKKIDGSAACASETQLFEQVELCEDFHFADINDGKATFYSSRLFESDGDTMLIGCDSPGSSATFPLNLELDLFEDQVPVPRCRGPQMFERVTGILSKTDRVFESLHFDTVGSWAQHVSYRREHWAYADYPLTFDSLGNVINYNYWGILEYLKALKQWCDLRGDKFIEASGMKVYGTGSNLADLGKNGRWFIAPHVDSSWHEGSFKVNEIGLFAGYGRNGNNGYDYERTVIGRKAYRIASGNIIKGGNPPTVDDVKRALSQNTAYGMPSPIKFEYFITDPNEALYLPDYSKYSRDQELWEQYLPTAEAMRLARWQPVTHARHNRDQNEIVTERFGATEPYYFSLWTPEADSVSSVELTIDLAALNIDPMFAVVTEEISNTPLQMQLLGTDLIVTVPMEVLWTRVLKVSQINFPEFFNSWLAEVGEPNYDPNYNYNADNTINFIDYAHLIEE